MSEILFVVCGLVPVSIACFAIFPNLRRCSSRGKTSFSSEDLKPRMEAYASLSNRDVTGPKDDDKIILNAEAHQILLGTLKKVEAKSATLASVVVFALGFSLASIVAIMVAGSGAGTVPPATATPQNLLLFAFSVSAFIMLLPLCWSLKGIRQIDQHDFVKLKESDPNVRASAMQDALMEDLLKKERMFRQSQSVVMGNTSFVVIVVCVAALTTLF
ncbi:hypothetical protein [Paenirhodobacter sp.]|uniref:hypothetical protein n=1 Tax=Paenirhodobacter sp. TaxID=1965326 RepID=UPI003B502B2E